ncbi:sensor histidine kinase [Flagellimonas oceanensis]|uniref:sensor histidine kinase n=1 Tax=Flagellimonas oceanensis TaxID=2499163 RepID=UPI00197C20C3|nr:histidine kinase [Allomuricauda oceanensis]
MIKKILTSGPKRLTRDKKSFPVAKDTPYQLVTADRQFDPGESIKTITCVVIEYFSMDYARFKDFILKYKLYHIPFWLCYHLVWLTINIGGLSEVYDYLRFSDTSPKFYFYVVFQLIAVYFNLYYLIPKLLHVGRYFVYILAVLGTILICNAFITSGYFFATLTSGRTLFELFGVYPHQVSQIYFVWALPSTVASMTLAMSIKLGKNWLQTEKRRLRLEKENLETELKYLKSQINPHFLFNTINSIFALIHKNPDLASESLVNFSDLLRYQIYECNDEKTALDKELDFIENFIDLEKLRLDQGHTEMQFDIQDHTTCKQSIAPFILIPFIENAFKHVSKGKERHNFIRMTLETTNRSLQLHIENSKSWDDQASKEQPKSSGLGLKNVGRRLNLLYPGSHSLRIMDESDRFSVILKLEW